MKLIPTIVEVTSFCPILPFPFLNRVEGYGFLSFARKSDDKYGKKLMNTATKLAINAEKTASKRVVYKTAEATGYLIENKIADKISSLGKP